MPYVNKAQKRIALVSDKNYWVAIDEHITWGVMKEISGVDKDGSAMYQADVMLLALIKDWNLDDEDGKKLEINQKNIDLLKKEDIEVIVKEMGGQLEEPAAVKKAS